METQTGVWLLAALLLVVLNSALAEDKYVIVDGKLELRPKPPPAISNILWKHNGNLIAEWVKGLVDLTYYNTYRDRTTLDTSTGRLEVNNMGEADAGTYTVEINNVVQSPSYDVKVIKEVPQPEVVLRPLTCDAVSDEFMLTCDGNTGGAEPVTYSWREGAGNWKESGKIMKITRSETGVETFSCKMKNPVSEKESEPKDNPFFQSELPDSELWIKVLGAVMRSLAMFALSVTVVYFCFLKRESVRKLICPCQRAARSGRSPSLPDED